MKAPDRGGGRTAHPFLADDPQRSSTDSMSAAGLLKGFNTLSVGGSTRGHHHGDSDSSLTPTDFGDNHTQPYVQLRLGPQVTVALVPAAALEIRA